MRVVSAAAYECSKYACAERSDSALTWLARDLAVGIYVAKQRVYIARETRFVININCAFFFDETRPAGLWAATHWWCTGKYQGPLAAAATAPGCPG